MNLKGIGTFAFLILIGMGLGMRNSAAEPMAPAFAIAPVPSLMVQGQVVMISGALQITDTSGGQREVTMVMQEVVVLTPYQKAGVALSIDKSTHLEGDVNIGDKVEAHVTVKGRTLAIRKVS